MDRKRLDRLWNALEAARRSPQKAGDLEALAIMAGRTMRPGSNHPMWISVFPTHRPFPIPHHGGNREVSPRVRKVVLEHLETDAAAWEEILERAERNNNI
jgi:hypothetical protein